MKTEERNNLVLQDLPLANKLAWKYNKITPKSVYVEELQSAAYLGLVDAASKTNESRRGSFGAYAAIRVLGAIKDYLRQLKWGGRNADFSVASLDTNVQEELSLGDVLLEASTNDDDISEFIEEVTKGLSPIGSKVVILYYVNSFTQREISRQIDVCESRVSQILQQALEFIRNRCSEYDLAA